MTLVAPTPLPPKLKLLKHIDRSKGETFEDLAPDDRIVYDAFWVEKKRRKDPSIPGVAQEALGCVAWLRAQGRSVSDADNEYGYSYEWTIKPAKNEEQRIVRELSEKPSKDIAENPACPLDVADVMIKHDITEFAPDPEPIPE